MKKKENSKGKVGIYLTPAGHALSHAIPECDSTMALLERGSGMQMRVMWLVRG